nr:hypothetical protein Iba_chr12fCG7360 [Ipomoea batatas]
MGALTKVSLEIAYDIWTDPPPRSIVAMVFCSSGVSGCNSVGTTPSASCRSGSRDLAAASGSSAYELNPGDEIQVLVKTENMDPAAGAAGVKYNGVAIGFVAEEHSPDMRPGETSQGQEEKCKGYEEKMTISLIDHQHLHHSLYASKEKRL